MTVTYAGTRFETEAFGKTMLVRILKEVSRREDRKTSILWGIGLKTTADKQLLTQLAKTLAADMAQEFDDVKEAFGAAQDVDAHLGRRFQIPPRDSCLSRAVEQAAVADGSIDDAKESGTDGDSEDDMPL